MGEPGLALTHATMADTTPLLSPEATFPLVPQALFEDLKVRLSDRTSANLLLRPTNSRCQQLELAYAVAAQPAGPRAAARWR